MSERDIPREIGVVAADLSAGGGAATPSMAAPDDDGRGGLPGAPAPTRIGPRTFRWGSRTYVMGIVNVTPDSFSGDGLLAAPGSEHGGAEGATTLGAAAAVAAAVGQARRMVEEGADLLDVGGESSRPGHSLVSADEEIARVVPVVAAIRAALPDVPVSVDTIKLSVAAAALDAGAHLINDVWGVAEDDTLARLAAERHVPLILMHNRAEARYVNLLPEILSDLQRAIGRALDAGIAWDDLIVDPGFGFGKAPDHNLALLRQLGELRLLGRPVLLGTSRKSTLGKVLDLPPGERLEATLATTVLAVAASLDVVRVHDVRANVRVARMADAVLRSSGHALAGHEGTPAGTGSRPEGGRT